MNPFVNAATVVVKVGTSTLTYETGLINIRRFEALVKAVSDLHNSGRRVVLVSSGAIAVGCGHMGLRERPADTPTRQAMAAVGQCELMRLYNEYFSFYNHNVAQVLVTKDIMEDAMRRQNVVNTFHMLMEHGAIPIVNENDTVAVDELEGENIGDNDTLSAMVAQLVAADALVIMSDIEGLFDQNPHRNPGARRIPVVKHIDDTVRSLASGSTSNRGTGGMITKIHAAEIAVAAGIDMAIVNGQDPLNLYRLLFDGEQVGTHFVATPKEHSQRRA